MKPFDFAQKDKSNGQMATIYYMKQGQKVYVGSTTRGIRIRMSEHKSHSRHGLDFDKCSVFPVETCSNEKRYERENHWILKLSKKYIVVNKAKASVGPIGCKRPERLKKLAGEMMKERWKTDRKNMLKRVNAHKTKTFQSKAGTLGALARAKKRPWFVIECAASKKIIGRFQDDQKAADALGWSIDVFRHFKRGNKRQKDIVLRRERG